MTVVRQLFILIFVIVFLNGLHWSIVVIRGKSSVERGSDETKNVEGISTVEDLMEWTDRLDLPEHLVPTCSALPECMSALSRLASSPSSSSELSEVQRRRLEELSGNLGRRMAMEKWLGDNGWTGLVEPLRRAGVGSLNELKEFQYEKSQVDLGWKILKDVRRARQYLPDDKEEVRRLEDLVLVHLQEKSKGTQEIPAGGAFSKLLTVMATVFVCWLVWDLGLTPTEVLWGAPLHKSFTRIEWPEDMSAAHSKTLSVAFYDMRGRPVEVADRLASLQADAWHQHRRVNAFVSTTTDSDDDDPASSYGNVVHVTFSSREAGRYYVTLKCQGSLVRGFPALAFVEAGLPDPKTTVLVGSRSSTLVLTAGVPDTVQIDPRDSFGNSMPKSRLPAMSDRFRMKLLERLGEGQEGNTLEEMDPNFVVYHTPIMDTLCASMAFSPGQEGWYRASVTLDGEEIGEGNGDLTLIVLSRQERAKVNQYVEGGYDNLPFFEAELVSEKGFRLSKPKTVWCSLTTKQMTVRDYFLRIFPRKLYNFRLVPSTKVVLGRYGGSDALVPVIRLQDGFQGNPELLMKMGNIFAACFYLMVLHKMGGSESFSDKQNFFNAKLLTYHQDKGHKHTRMPVRVDRTDLIGSSYRATRWFSEADWCRLFEVQFEGEVGIDHGGLRREWFELLCKRLFHPSAGLFVSVEENSEAVFPNPNPSSDVKSKMYRFAGRVVGKCLYESAHGVTYRHQLPARLAKSFLAQLVGLRVHYKHFADDAPDLFSSKISFIETNPVSDLDLTFTDEEFGPRGELLRTADLCPGGSRSPVTESNKLEYLDALAQRRLCARVRDQTEAFLQGLNQMVPDSLLSLFDEQELELMLCGVREYSLGELRSHHDVVVGLSSRTQEWFWAALASFSPEQFARLLQFSTGSSQLPPGGFAEVRPRFQLAPGETEQGSLPTAHTCFNMICLPEHRSYKEFERALLTAINEGGEGFGLA